MPSKFAIGGIYRQTMPVAAILDMAVLTARGSGPIVNLSIKDNPSTHYNQALYWSHDSRHRSGKAVRYPPA
jgi:hypothetical protein